MSGPREQLVGECSSIHGRRVLHKWDVTLKSSLIHAWRFAPPNLCAKWMGTKTMCQLLSSSGINAALIFVNSTPHE